MADSKNFAASRRVQGSAAAIGVVLIQMLGLEGEEAQVIEQGMTAVLGIVALIQWAMHWIKPDARSVRPPGRAGGALLIFLVLPLACATNPEGKRVIDRSQCQNLCVQAQITDLSCNFIKGDDQKARDKREMCSALIDAASATCHAVCMLAEEVEPEAHAPLTGYESMYWGQDMPAEDLEDRYLMRTLEAGDEILLYSDPEVRPPS